MKSLSELRDEIAKDESVPLSYGNMSYFELGFNAGAHAVMERAEKLVEALEECERYWPRPQGSVVKGIARALLDWANFVKEK